ncbi:MAG TPA: glycosyltransferase [Blastocatellia bacterium]|nr:glycosyltransferase [Blastocatellia bacterium]
MSISVIIPAYNEGRYIASTLEHLRRAVDFARKANPVPIDLIVVDNASTDETAAIARGFGATIIEESVHNISRVRNAGAYSSNADVLVFVDADTVVPESLLYRISEVMSDRDCAGGAVDVSHRPSRSLIKAYLALWRMLGKLTGMAQGATQFCRREVFVSLRGYDESLYMGEDVDFYWRLKKLAKKRGLRHHLITDLQVIPSPRRFDQWSTWRILVWTNPLFALTFRRWKKAWGGWYEKLPR